MTKHFAVNQASTACDAVWAYLVGIAASALPGYTRGQLEWQCSNRSFPLTFRNDHAKIASESVLLGADLQR